MIEFEPKYVHCFWNNEVEGKKGFVADTLADLRMYVKDKAIPYLVTLTHSENEDFEFTSNNINECYQFCYYDPNYEMKVAYEEGKTIQYLSKITNKWVDCEQPLWNNAEYRIKHEEYQVVISFDEQGLAVVESGKDFGKVFFIGTKEECEKWVKDNYDISIVINGYFKDEPIVYKEKGVKNDPWKEIKDVPYDWDFDHYEYRINRAEESPSWDFVIHSKSKEYVPFENTQELIEAWEKKCPANKDRPNGTMPLIWIKEKENENNISLITDFNSYGVSTSCKDMSFDSLFEKYIFADGSVCGKRK